jgi:hypothetical protein
MERVRPGGDVLDRKSLLAQALAHELGGVRIIFDDEQSIRHANLTRL